MTYAGCVQSPGKVLEIDQVPEKILEIYQKSRKFLEIDRFN